MASGCPSGLLMEKNKTMALWVILSPGEPGAVRLSLQVQMTRVILQCLLNGSRKQQHV